MTGASYALKIGSLVLGLGVLLVIAKKLKGFKRFGVAGLVYTVFTAILLAVPAFFVSINLGISEAQLLIFSQLYIVFLGIIHVNLVKNAVDWYPEQKLNLQIVFIIVFLVFGFFISNIIFSFLQEPELRPIFWYISLIWFLIPVLLNETINRLMNMPAKEFRTWQYPIGENIEDPSDAELDNPIVISFVFTKNAVLNDLTTFRAKAPAGMALGRLFYFFINDYNGRHPEGPISFVNENKEPDPWVFYKLKNKLFRTKEALNQDEAISENNIRENDVLICKRVDRIVK